MKIEQLKQTPQTVQALLRFVHSKPGEVFTAAELSEALKMKSSRIRDARSQLPPECRMNAVINGKQNVLVGTPMAIAKAKAFLK
jgi:hypothetical protein